jgi:carbon-monoxide dehydrogenase medium subunit
MTFVAPSSVDDVLAELAEDDAIALAGGTSVAMMLKNDLLEATRIVSLRNVRDLRGIGIEPSGDIRLGATSTLRELSRSTIVGERLPALAEAAGLVGNPRVRAVATLGGATVHGDPRQDLPPVLLALGARLRIAGPAGVREVPAAEFFLGFMATAIDEDELVLDVRVPVAPGQLSAYARFVPGSVEDYPIVAVGVAVDLAGDGTVAAAGIGLGGVIAQATSAQEAASVLVGRAWGPESIAAAARAAAAAAPASDDQRGSADYKRTLFEVWTARTLTRCLARG